MKALERQRLEVGTKAKVVAAFPEADDWRRQKRFAELPKLVDAGGKPQPEIERRAREETRQLRRSLRTGEKVTVARTAPWMSNPTITLAPLSRTPYRHRDRCSGSLQVKGQGDDQEEVRGRRPDRRPR
jgi:hypothetical protein